MKPAQQHALARSIRQLAVGIVRDTDQRRSARAENAMAEREEQFQVAVSGIATDYPLWTAAQLPFETSFSIATGQRASTLQRPQLNAGYELVDVRRQNDELVWEAVPDGVILSVVVRSYHFDSYATIDAANVVIAAIAPGDELQFSGFVHLAFQGFGAPRDQTDEAG